MDVAFDYASVVALVTAIGVAIKNVVDIKTFKRWICTKNPCPDRISQRPPDD